MPRTDRTALSGLVPCSSCGLRNCTLYRLHLKVEPRVMLIPTLDGLRLSLYHTSVPVSLLEWASPGEKFAITWDDKAFLSPLVPPRFIRYVLVHFHHYHCRRWTEDPSEFLRRLTPGPSQYRTIMIAASLARLELSPDAYRDYWAWRQTASRGKFFLRSPKTMEGVRRRIERLAELWEKIQFARGISSVSELTEPVGSAYFRQYRSRFRAGSFLSCGSGTDALS